MKKEKLTIKSTNERIDSLESKLDLIIKKLNTLESINGVTISKQCKQYCIVNIEDGAIIDGYLENIVPEDIIDEFNNYYVKLTPLYVKKLNDNQVKLSTEEFEGAVKLVPQLISKYKNSLIKGQCRSIPNVTPDFTQFSYNKSKKFAEWVDGKIMNWETQLYIQLVYLATYGTKKNDDYIPNEDCNWDAERDCGFGDTGQGIGEFLGIEQLFTSGKNFISFGGYDDENKSCLWNIYKLLNYDVKLKPSNGLFGIWGDYGKTSDSIAPFYSDWNYGFDDAWIGGGYGLRLCKAFEKKN